jgi:uncharacterized surface protein with fasciclin (FAS1) repeats
VFLTSVLLYEGVKIIFQKILGSCYICDGVPQGGKDMITRFRWLIVLLVFVSAHTFMHADTKTEESPKPSPFTIIDIAQNNPNFSTFLTAVRAADLTTSLQGTGPFTIFIPTNDAFAKLPNGVLQDLLKPENKDKLKEILLYHIVPGKMLSSDAKTIRTKSINGKDLNIVVKGDTIKINNANVSKHDVVASNGVIHVIDTVLIPQSY